MLEDSKLIYPYPSIIHWSPTWIEENKSTGLALKWQSSLVSFFITQPHHKQEAFLIGSGFLCLLSGQIPCIVTASHVIKDMQQSDFSFISIDGKKFKFEHLEIYFNDDQDYAIIPMPEEIIKEIPQSILFNNRCDNEKYEKTSSFVIMGYPSKANKLHKLRPEKGLSPFNINFHGFLYERETEDIYFHFVADGKEKNICFEDVSTNKTVTSLAGMSGSVIAQLIINKKSGEVSLKSVGIFKEHRPKRGDFLVGSTFIDFADEINSYLESVDI
ncbi:serine protease [Erwinia phyllosphaerae]|uniref:serine protease n=1 Tax=Erwinia phyllosphaerae TaxID=2853256 RepID=UPI001FED6F98|nr:serine protease [Erwinia phyllosphaerae]MBV4369005.1 serine protease [Erwinia phyllosphaerae]